LTVVCTALTIYSFIVLAVIVMSWFPLQPGGPAASVHGFLFRLTEPVLGPIRRTIPAVRVGGMALDLSPIFLLIAIQILQRFICG
jgi:YggT family protein